MTSPSTSASLLYRVQKMEIPAWERFSGLYGPLVYSWCRRASLQESDASDVTQEVFRSVYQHIGKFEVNRERGSFRGWLWTLTTNQIRLFYRRGKTQVQAQGGSDAQHRLAEVADPLLPDEEPDAEAARRQLLQRALDLVREDFSEQTWTIFERTTLRNETYQHVATALAMSENAVRQARFRVLRRLRQEFEGLF